MTTYVDSSALLKVYLDEADSALAEELLSSDLVLVTSWVTAVEVRRNLARLLGGTDLISARTRFNDDLDAFAMVGLDEITARAAAAIGETLGVKSLDALHLASAQRLQIPTLSFVTFDLKQAQAARSLGFTVLGC